MSEITVLGIGNILLQDEGFGVKTVEALERRYEFPASVRVLDGGTLGMELLRFLSGVKKLLVVDAVNGDGAPGTFYRIAGDAVEAYFQASVSMHELGVKDVLASLLVLDEPIEEVVVIGVQPASMELGVGLTPPVDAQVAAAAAAAVAQLREWGAEVTERAAE